MLPKKYIGEQFYFDNKILVDNVPVNINIYQVIEAFLVGQHINIAYRYPAQAGYESIVKIDDYTLRYYVTSEHTTKLGVGTVKIEIKGIVADAMAPNGILKPIFAGNLFTLVDNKIGKL